MLRLSRILLVVIALCCMDTVNAQSYPPDVNSQYFGVIQYDDGTYHDTYGFHYGFAIAIGLDDFSTDTTQHLGAAHIDSYLGWRFGKKVSLTSGLGFEFNESRIAGFRFDTQFLTFYLGGRYNLTNTKYMPFVYGRVGYGFGPPQEGSIVNHDDGTNYQAGVGLTFPSPKPHKYFVAVAWHHQQAKGTESFIDPLGNEINTKYDILINRLVIKFGMELN